MASFVLNPTLFLLDIGTLPTVWYFFNIITKLLMILTNCEYKAIYLKRL